MKEELERYRRLLEGWQADDKPAAGPPPRPAASDGENSGGNSSGKAKLRRPGTPEAAGRFPVGTVVVVDDEELAVYFQAMPGSSTDMIYALLSDGTAKPEASDLNGKTVRPLGKLSLAALKDMQTSKRWTRDAISSVCEDPADAEMIPEPEGAPAPPPKPTPSPAPEARRPEPPPEPRRPSPPPATEPRRSDPTPRPDPPPRPAPAQETTARAPRPQFEVEKPKLRRGVRVSLMFGGKKWEAIYWGRDTRGTVIAHKTHRNWELMHLDLEQYKESMIVSPEVDEPALEEIMRFLDTCIAE